MTIEKRPNATADKNAPTQAPRVPAVERGGGPKLPGPPGVPGTERFRLLAYVKQESMVRVDKRPDETVLTWPHLLRAEFLMAMLISGLLVVTSFFIQAPLEEMANAGATPHVAKAPWYFLGLQEILSYFNATVAGVLRAGPLPRRPGAHPVHRSLAVQGGARPEAHLGLLPVPDDRRAASSPSSARSSAAPAGTGSGRGRGSSSAYDRSASPPTARSTGRRVGEMSRRTFMRRMVGLGVGLLSLEFLGGSLAFLWPNIQGGLGGQINIGTAADIVGKFPGVGEGHAVRLQPGAPLHRQRAGRARRSSQGQTRRRRPGDEARPERQPHRSVRARAVPQVPAPRLPDPAPVRQERLVRVPVPRQQVHRPRREARRSRAARHGPLQRHRRLGGQVRRRHQPDHRPARRSGR